ncbi:hypothetical protein [Streptomyces sp. JW3]|uniref:hypothetical protein n=1 Tax=Streptomyces sp. JW3 TaxID=3456955 RepID=UPI003FA453B8
MPRTRSLVLGLYGDARDLAWAGRVVENAVTARAARIAGRTVVPASGDYDYLADQWAREHPGTDPAHRRAVELRVRLTCSLRVWRAVRKAVPAALCPAEVEPHVCRVPWSA